MLNNFDPCVAFTFKEEGGYSNIPGDKGGPTNFGITQNTLGEWRKKPVTAADVRNLDAGEAKDIYRTKYWRMIEGDYLPRGVDLMVFDEAVNAGWGTSAKLLQGLVWVKQDGMIGPKTMNAVLNSDPGILIQNLEGAQEQYYRSLGGFDKFGKGWLLRLGRRTQAALHMVGPHG